MNYKDYLSITPEVEEALASGKPVVALESTILSHGMPGLPLAKASSTSGVILK